MTDPTPSEAQVSGLAREIANTQPTPGPWEDHATPHWGARDVPGECGWIYGPDGKSVAYVCVCRECASNRPREERLSTRALIVRAAALEAELAQTKERLEAALVELERVKLSLNDNIAAKWALEHDRDTALRERDEALAKLASVAELSKPSPMDSPDPLCPKAGFLGLSGIEQAEIHRLATTPDEGGEGDGSIS